MTPGRALPVVGQTVITLPKSARPSAGRCRCRLPAAAPAQAGASPDVAGALVSVLVTRVEHLLDQSGDGDDEEWNGVDRVEARALLLDVEALASARRMLRRRLGSPRTRRSSMSCLLTSSVPRRRREHALDQVAAVAAAGDGDWRRARARG